MNDDLQQGHVFLIEDDLSLKESISDILEFKQYLVRSFNSAHDFLKSLDINIAPAVVVSDMRMPGIDGIELQRLLHQDYRPIPIVFISGESTVSQSITALKKGAVDFLLKPFEIDELISAIDRGIDIDRNNMQKTIKKNELDDNLQKLSPRERQVFELLCKGFSNGEIMQELQISLPTAKQYKSEVMHKLNAKTIAELIRLKVGVM